MSISVVIPDSSTSRDNAGQTWLDAALSFLLVVVFPTVFWLGLAEVAMIAAGHANDNVGRIVSGVLLVGFLTFVWAMLRSGDDDDDER